MSMFGEEPFTDKSLVNIPSGCHVFGCTICLIIISRIITFRFHACQISFQGFSVTNFVITALVSNTRISFVIVHFWIFHLLFLLFGFSNASARRRASHILHCLFDQWSPNLFVWFHMYFWGSWYFPNHPNPRRTRAPQWTFFEALLVAWGAL